MTTLWIGLLEVRAKDGAANTDMAGAFTTGVTFADSAEAAKILFASALEDEQMELISVSDLETFERRCAIRNSSKETRSVARYVNRTHKTEFGTFTVGRATAQN